MCQVCTSEWAKEKRRSAYAKKRKQKGLIATRRLIEDKSQAERLSLWGSVNRIAKNELNHIDLG